MPEGTYKVLELEDGQEGTPEVPEVLRLEWIAEECAGSMPYYYSIYNSTVPSVGEA